jgi:hypothetical protein
MILFLDDIREPRECYSLKHRERFRLPPFTQEQIDIVLRNRKNNTTFWVKSYDEAVKFIQENGLPEMIFFDNDLGEGLEGYDFLKWICNQNLGFFEAYFHTANWVARENMKYYYNSWIKSL